MIKGFPYSYFRSGRRLSERKEYLGNKLKVSHNAGIAIS